ncbi:class D sortase [Paenibacillus ihumii]|uniref:class D sortase n=1 Tax=Paenibacillus ihumii TaxID=687436 RepID=UPI0006D7F87E|nr:class D sortase [Paenibacillus ihumii]
MKKFISYTLIMLGLLIMLYPKANEYYENAQTDELLQGIESNADIEDDDATAERKLLMEYRDASRILDESFLTEEVNDHILVEETHAVEKSTVTNQGPNEPKAIAVIKIEKIKLNLPVLEGATKKNMKYAAAHLKETDALGEPGNAAIAAHRARTKGRLFNRLNEIEVGDEIRIEVGSKAYVYEAEKISVVKPTDVSVLKREGNEQAILTLITCEPINNPTHRLIVKAKLKDVSTL